MDKKAVVHLHNEVLLVCKKGGSLTLCDSRDGPGDFMRSEISQSEKDKYHMFSLIYAI